MALSAGDKLGPYEIVELIGKGGMGEVYRARDARVGRDVAIKVSQERFNERFDREVRAVAALNHPNICTLYDVGPNYLVMELVEGDSPKGPLPLEEALRIARQIAEALEEAHEKNIVHRDLKPANIKIKADGTVKVLDFGLAKMGSGPAAQSEDSPTLSMAATQAGVILGTAGYMAPEQARGKPTDRRADIWAFGVIFHELLTGKKLFSGEDVTESLAKVIQAEPSWEGVPPKVQRLLKKCLEKDPRKRLRDIGDAWELLEETPSSRAREGGVRWLWPGIAAALALIAAASTFIAWRATQPVDHPLVRLEVDLGADVALPPPGNGTQTLAISPDGTRLAYIAAGKVWTRRLDQPKASELPGTTGVDSVFFSPDSRWVGFHSGNKVSKISVEGGAVVPLGDSPNFAGASWGEDNGVLIGGAFNQGLTRIPSGGGAPVTVLEMASGEVAQAFPQLLPGGKAVLFSAYATLGADTATVQVLTLSDHRRKTLTRGTSPRYVAGPIGPGYLVYNNKATLFAVPFDLDRLEMRGTAVPVLDDLEYIAGQSETAQFDVSPGLNGTGTLVYRKGTGTGPDSGMMNLESVIVGADGAGKREPLRKKPGVYLNPRLSPDGKRVALVVNEGGKQDLWVYNQPLDAMARLTSTGTPITTLTWSPDGRYIVFGSLTSGIFWTRADGATQPQVLIQGKSVLLPWSFSADGKRLVYSDAVGTPQLWTVPITDDAGQLKAGTAEQFLKSQSVELTAAFSPDGKFLAYSSNESSNPELYVRPFPPPASGQGGKWQISNSGGVGPSWSSNGRDLFYVAGDQIMAVSYSAKDGAFQAEKPRVWLSKLGGAQGDLSPDGKRAVVLSPVQAQEAPKTEHEVVFLQNFFDELRRRAPVK